MAKVKQSGEAPVDGAAVAGDAAEGALQAQIEPEGGHSAKAEPEALVKARVLVDCDFGKCGDVVEVPADQVKALADFIDTNPDAVAYAESIKAPAQ